jgi:GR25 family glycosyltransferase involved in LPS biosynthesis
MNPFDFFEFIVCINLERRPERWEESLMEFDKLGITDKVIRFNAIESPDSSYGNHLSHASILRYAVEQKLDNVLIFEDDVEFFPGAIRNLTNSIKDLPEDWDMFYLGANLDSYKAYKVTPHLAKLTGAFATHAYAIRHTLFSKLIDINTDVTTIHNDVSYANLIHPNYNCFLTLPLVAGQRESYSDIQKKVMKSNPVFIERLKSNLVD